jgi:hypothetical protein
MRFLGRQILENHLLAHELDVSLPKTQNFTGNFNIEESSKKDKTTKKVSFSPELKKCSVNQL